MSEFTLWPHQVRAISERKVLIARRQRRICVTSPTGMGKTRTMLEMIREDLADGLKVSLYTNRKLLLEQISEAFKKHGIAHGKRAAGHFPDLENPFQISSIQTENARVIGNESWELHDADRVYVDEAHLHCNDTAARIFGAHLDKPDSVITGFTATPIGVADFYDNLLVAGTPSEGRACGALVPAWMYGPSEPDLKHVGRVRVGEDLTENQNKKAIMVPGIFGLVFDWWKRLNSSAQPTILFAPGVPESLWFAEQFTAMGVPAAHIDGEEVWHNGQTFKSDREVRAAILLAFKKGKIKVLCNRFVLREGIDVPEVRHLILASVFGSLQTYLQAVGRGLRASPSKDKLVIQCHGGNWHRHGSPNADREWCLDYRPHVEAELRLERMRNKEVPEPFLCPQCCQVLAKRKCPCGYEIPAGSRKSRPVLQADGKLVEYFGDIYRQPPTKVEPDTLKLWRSMYFRFRNAGGKTFRQLLGFFLHEHGYLPPKDFPFMPKTTADQFRVIEQVPVSELTS